MTTRITEFCDGVLALDGKATPGPWIQGTVFLGDVFSPAENLRSRVIVEGPNKDEKQIHDAKLIAAYRTSAPALARALKKAVEAIETAPHASRCNVGIRFSTSKNAEEIPCDCWKSRALAEIAELIPKQ